MLGPSLRPPWIINNQPQRSLKYIEIATQCRIPKMEEVVKMRIWLTMLIIAFLCFTICGSAEDVKVEGVAIKDFHRIGAWGWEINVTEVISGPVDSQGKTIAVYQTSANPADYPPGFLDPDIKAGDRVEAYGQQEPNGNYDILITGSTEYYLKRVNNSDGGKTKS